MSAAAEALQARLAEVHRRVRSAGGDTDAVTICAVTKGHPLDAVRTAVACGLVDVGESYAQELEEKVAGLGSDAQPRWHFVGRLQRNKVKLVAPHVHLWQSIDRLALGELVARHAAGAAVLVQVATLDEVGKAGCPEPDVPALVDGLRALELDVRGLMAVGPTDPTLDPRPGFTRVRALADRLGLREVSMGMSSDLEAGVACGATIVRPGTALFGPRPRRGQSGQ